MGEMRKHLSKDGLHATVRRAFKQEKIAEKQRSSFSWEDCLMSGLAIFGLKFPSLLQFEKRRKTDPMVRNNLKTLYGVKTAPSDTCLRERLDTLSPKQLRRPFKAIFAQLQRGKVLERYRYLDGHYILSVDGTGQYSSNKVHCKNCCEKKHRNGKITYYHQMLGASIVHPHQDTVIPLAPEPIVKGDGNTKNDSERNAAKRLLADVRREHPHLKLLVVEDALASNYPHLATLDSLKMRYIVGAKPGDHKYLFKQIENQQPQEHYYKEDNGTHHYFKYYSDVSLNKEHSEYQVHFLDYREINEKGVEQHFTWVTNLSLDAKTVYRVMRAARSRWQIENETFNTLKKQGYHFEHNYGHGNENLCSVMITLLVLAFLIDQVVMLCSQVYRKAYKLKGALYVIFEQVRVLFQYARWQSWDELYERLAWSGADGERAPPLPI